MINKAKKINAIATTFLFCLYFFLDWYWSNECVLNGCGAGFINSFLAPLMQASLFLGLLFAIFLFLPTKYFKAWLKKIVIWLLPVSTVIVYLTPASRTFWFDREQTVVIMGIVGAVVTVTFLLYKRFVNNK